LLINDELHLILLQSLLIKICGFLITLIRKLF
jgi:hypothetical protein